MKLAIALFIPLIVVAIVAYSQASISATPLYLSVPTTFVVLNVINTSYVGFTNTSPSQNILHAGTQFYIDIAVKNAYTGQVVVNFTAYLPPQYLKYLYYSPTMKSVIFLVNVSSNKLTYVPIYTIQGLPLYVYNYSGGITTNIAVIPLGWFVFANGTPLNSTNTYFSTNMEGNAIIQTAESGYMGYYSIYFVT